ncbi:hypothetical protein B0H14DRAFT_3137927 [Mycena olivaceomarginata]|nr:hypothetical protein B0H14DRAFT_3137927 [Mycena olivaceomarginata]
MAASASSRLNSTAEQLSQATLKMYDDRPELDPRQDLTEFVQCRNTDDIMLTLKKRINTLKDFRDDHWVKIYKKLESIVHVLVWVTNTAGESTESIATQAQSARYDILEKLLKRLDTVLLCFNVLCEKIFSHPCPALDEIATTILAHLFYILALSTKFLRKPRGRHYLRGLIGFSDDLKEALQKLDNFWEKTNTYTLNLPQLKKNEQNIYIISGIHNKVQNLTTSSRNGFLGISFAQLIRQLTEMLLSIKGKKAQATGLLQNSDFKNWRSFKGKSVLWLHGGSGTGKTILSAYVVDTLLNSVAPGTEVVYSIPDLSYFFFRVKAKEDLEGMLSSTLLQLACGPERHKILRDAYNSDGCKGPPSRSSLLTYFKMMLTDIGAVEVDLNRELNQKDDLCKYITGVLQLDSPFREWKHSHPDIINLIKHRLFDESMFRLVALQLDQLRDSAPIDVKATLETLPHSLVEMYEHILQSLESKHPKTAQRVMHVFEIISCASRSLSAEEAAEVFAVQFNSDNSVQVLEEYRLKNPTRELVEKCTSAFIRIEKSTIQFAHASVLEYLRNPGVSRATPRLDPASYSTCSIPQVSQP